MADQTLVDSLEEIALWSVAVTNASLAQAGEHALSFEQWRAMVVLGEASDGVRISTVARQVGVTLPATSRLLQRLARRGLVAFEEDPADGRATISRLTPEGEALRDAVMRYRRERLTEVVRSVDLPDGARQILAELAAGFRKTG